MQGSSTEDSATQKLQLRKRIRRKRAELDRRAERSQTVCQRIIELESYQNASRVHLYIEAGSEVATKMLVASAFSLGKTVVVPWCTSDDRLAFFWIQSTNDLTLGSHGILEPSHEITSDSSRKVLPESIPFWIIPGIAFDKQGGRMGQGRGHYDRVLSTLPASTITLGLAFDCQLVDEVPREPHDRPLSGVATETGLFWRDA